MKRLKMLGVGKSRRGYTIVEALIFLAVSGALLVSAGTVISGRQERTRFSQAIDDVSQNLQDVFNDASTGFYPSANNIICSVTGTPGSTLTLGSNPSIQGTNQACIFAGKLIEFPTNTTTYNIYTAVANRNATSLNTSIMKLLGKNSNPGISETKINNIDLRTTKIVPNPNPSGVTYPSIVVLSDFGNVTGTTVSGNAGKLKLYGYNQNISSGDVTTAQLVPITGNSTLVICLRQDGNNASRIGSVTITPQLTIDRQIGTQETVCA